MSGTAKLVESWNLIFNYKIRENDLQKPTENFLFNVLVDYLKKLRMDIAPQLNLYNHPSNEVRRAFKIKFCAYIDHIYKVSCADSNFLYYDLIRPSPKKTTHMLKILLNYYLYVEKLHKDTIEVVLAAKKGVDRLLNKKSKYQSEIESYKTKLEENSEKITHYNEILPKLTEEIERLISQEKEQAYKIAQLDDAVKYKDAILSQLKRKEEELKGHIVSDEEAENLLTNKIRLEKAISEQEELKKATLVNLEEQKKLIDEMEPVNEKIELTMKDYPVDELNPPRKMKLKLQQVSQKYAAQQAASEIKKNIIERKLELLEKNEKIIMERKETLENIQVMKQAEIVQMERNLENLSKSGVCLENELQSTEKVLEEQNDYGDFLVKSIDLIVDKLVHSIAGFGSEIFQ